MKYFSIFAVLLPIFLTACSSESADLHMITDDELMKELSDTSVVVLDVRTPDEYDHGHIAHAKLMNVYDDDFKTQVKTLNKTKTYVIYCASSGRAAKAAKIMMQDGFQKVYDLKYGYNHWKGPVEK